MATPIVTTLKSSKQILARKALIIGAAATGLIVAGGILFAASQAGEKLTEAEVGSTN